MLEFVRKTELRCDPGSQNDSGIFVPRGGLGLGKRTFIQSTQKKKRQRGEKLGS